jgi:hypothetical protein
MVFSLIAADEMCPVQDNEKGELALMERAPSSLVADHVRSPEKDTIDFWNQSIQSSQQHSRQLHATFLNRSVNIWPQRETLRAVSVPDGWVGLVGRSLTRLLTGASRVHASKGIEVTRSPAGLAA